MGMDPKITQLINDFEKKMSEDVIDLISRNVELFKSATFPSKEQYAGQVSIALSGAAMAVVAGAALYRTLVRGTPRATFDEHDLATSIGYVLATIYGRSDKESFNELGQLTDLHNAVKKTLLEVLPKGDLEPQNKGQMASHLN